MTTDTLARPQIVSRGEWLVARKQLLAKEKELTRRGDALAAERRRLPMVRLEQDYVFDGPGGKARLRDLFEDRSQLIVYHFMFEPDDPPPGKTEPWSEGCSGCSFLADNIPHLAHLHARDTTLVLVSRAPLAKILPFKKRMGWTVPWYSSFGSDFNYDFHVTLDEAAGSTEWNYQSAEALVRAGKIPSTKGELPGLSIFLHDDESVFHTYSTYARGLDQLATTYTYLDLTPYGRQEDWEDSPPGWPQTTMFWTRHHDKYNAPLEQAESCCHAAEAR